MNKKKLKRLQDIQAHLQRVVDYMSNPRVQGIAIRVQDPTGADYTINNTFFSSEGGKQSQFVSVVDHCIGSEMALLYEANKSLQQFLLAEFQEKLDKSGQKETGGDRRRQISTALTECQNESV